MTDHHFVKTTDIGNTGSEHRVEGHGFDER